MSNIEDEYKILKQKDNIVKIEHSENVSIFDVMKDLADKYLKDEI